MTHEQRKERLYPASLSGYLHDPWTEERLYPASLVRNRASIRTSSTSHLIDSLFRKHPVERALPYLLARPVPDPYLHSDSNEWLLLLNSRSLLFLPTTPVLEASTHPDVSTTSLREALLYGRLSLALGASYWGRCGMDVQWGMLSERGRWRGVSERGLSRVLSVGSVSYPRPSRIVYPARAIGIASLPLHFLNEMPVLIWPGEGETREEWEMIAGSQTCINANVNAEQNDTSPIQRNDYIYRKIIGPASQRWVGVGRVGGRERRGQSQSEIRGPERIHNRPSFLKVGQSSERSEMCDPKPYR